MQGGQGGMMQRYTDAFAGVQGRGGYAGGSTKSQPPPRLRARGCSPMVSYVFSGIFQGLSLFLRISVGIVSGMFQ